MRGGGGFWLWPNTCKCGKLHNTQNHCSKAEGQHSSIIGPPRRSLQTHGFQQGIARNSGPPFTCCSLRHLWTRLIQTSQWNWNCGRTSLTLERLSLFFLLPCLPWWILRQCGCLLISSCSLPHRPVWVGLDLVFQFPLERLFFVVWFPYYFSSIHMLQ